MPQDALQDRTVGEEKYLIGYLPPREAVKLWARVAKHLLPTLAASIPKNVTDKQVGDLDITQLDWERASAHLVELLAEEQFAKDLELLLSVVFTEDNVKVTLASFPGRIGQLLKVAAASMEVNFSDFFAAFKPLLNVVKARLARQTADSTPEKAA